MTDWASVLHVKISFVVTSFANAVAALEAHTIDIMPNLNRTALRSLAVTFTNDQVPITDAYAFSSSAHPYASWQQLDSAKVTVCVQIGSADDQSLIENPPSFTIVRLPSRDACHLALQSGQVDATVDDMYAQASYAAATAGTSILFPPSPSTEQGDSYAIADGYQYSDIQALNTELDNYRSEGKMTADARKFNVASPLPFTVAPVPTYVTTLLSDAGL
jgi:polar amino acid transport system substrate-binding protein